MIPTNEVKEYIKTLYLKHFDAEFQAGRRPGDAKFRQWLKLDDPEKKHQFITIALPKDLGIMQLKKYIYSLDYKYLQGVLLCCEFFSEVGENLHVHILKHGVYSKTRIIRDLSRKFKIEENFVDVRLGKRESDYENRYAYITGDKESESKQANVYLDREWRKQNGLQDLYTL